MNNLEITKADLESSVEIIRKSICAYHGNRCDCKFGVKSFERVQCDEKGSGCPELYVVLELLRNMSVREFRQIVLRKTALKHSPPVNVKPVWCVKWRDPKTKKTGWCATFRGHKPSEDAISDRTACDHCVSLRGGSEKRLPTCASCLERIFRRRTHRASK